VTGENRVFGAEHDPVSLVRHKSHVNWLGFGAGLRGECLNHIDMITLLHCYLATLLHCNIATLLNCYIAKLLHCYTESVQSQFATAAAVIIAVRLSVSTTQQNHNEYTNIRL